MTDQHTQKKSNPAASDEDHEFASDSFEAKDFLVRGMPAELHKSLKILAIVRGETMGNFIIEVIKLGLEQVQKELKIA